MTTWYILRHAEKAGGDFPNPRLPLPDEPLSPKGRQDAERLVPFFTGRPVAAIYVSAYQRTLQTVAPVARALGLTPQADERLNEINNSGLVGLNDAEIRQKYPDVWKAYTERTADFRFPGGETGAEAQRRIASFLEEVRPRHEQGDVLLVSHDGLIRLLACHLLGLPVYRRWNFQVDFCGLMEISWQPDFASWKLVHFNQIVGHA
jgi:broad specificity phosphatase PhoE